MKQLLIIIIFFFLGCLKQNGPVIKDGAILFYPTTDTVYDLELMGDTLYVANGISGLKILKINLENVQQPLDSLFEGNLDSGVERFVDVIVSDNYLFLLEKQQHLEYVNATTYILNRKFPLEPDKKAKLTCHTYQSKIVFSGVNEFSDNEELIILRQGRDSEGNYLNSKALFVGPFAPDSVYVFKKDCVDIELNKFNDNGINILHDDCESLLDCNNDPNGTARVDNCSICSGGNTGLTPCPEPVDCNGIGYGNSSLNNCGDCISVLNDNLSDIEYYKRNDGYYLYLTNSNEETTSVQIFKRKSQNSFDFDREDILSNKILTIKVYEDSYIVGLDDNKGACISLHDLNLDNSDAEFECIASGFTIQDIRYDYSTNLLTLSAGYDGVLVYDWSGNGDDKPTPRAMIASGYAYSALVFDINKIIVGTKNGIEIYEI